MRLKGKVAIITGGAHGMGEAEARLFAKEGAAVVIADLLQKEGEAVAADICAQQGRATFVTTDVTSEAAWNHLIATTVATYGRLDILVNNAAAVHDELTAPGHFWEKPLKLADIIDVGLRSSYVASYYAAPIMTAHRRGLVVFTSGGGSVHYVFGAAYGAQKAGQDKLAADMAVDLKDFNVAAISIWMGAVLTDRLEAVIASDPVKYGGLRDKCETPEFTGHVIWELFRDPKLMELSGQTLIGAEMAIKYGVKDAGGRQPPSYRDSYKVAPRVQYPIVIR